MTSVRGRRREEGSTLAMAMRPRETKKETTEGKAKNAG